MPEFGSYCLLLGLILTIYNFAAGGFALWGGSVGGLAGGIAGIFSAVYAHRQAVAAYAQRDGCSTTTTPMSPSWCDGLSQTNLPCTCVSYQGCASGYPVISCEYKAPHQQAPNPGPIWDFLAQF